MFADVTYPVYQKGTYICYTTEAEGGYLVHEKVLLHDRPCPLGIEKKPLFKNLELKRYVYNFGVICSRNYDRKERKEGNGFSKTFLKQNFGSPFFIDLLLDGFPN